MAIRAPDGAKKGEFYINKAFNKIYISLYSLNDLERSGKNFKTINHFPNQPLKMEIFRYFGISPLSTEFEEHLFVFFSTLIITLINTVFLLLQLFGCFLQQHPLCLHIVSKYQVTSTTYLVACTTDTQRKAFSLDNYNRVEILICTVMRNAEHINSDT